MSILFYCWAGRKPVILGSIWDWMEHSGGGFRTLKSLIGNFSGRVCIGIDSPDWVGRNPVLSGVIWVWTEFFVNLDDGFCTLKFLFGNSSGRICIGIDSLKEIWDSIAVMDIEKKIEDLAEIISEAQSSIHDI